MATPLYRFVKRIMHAVYNCRIDTPAILSAEDYFPEADHIARHWEAIRDESLNIAQNIQNIPLFHELMPEQKPISDNDAPDWRMFIVRAYGNDIEDNMAQCPTLAKLVKATPSITSAGLSFMAPHKVVPPHTGPFRGIIRYYLTLSMPLDDEGKPGVVLTVDGKDYPLHDGEYLVWDDTYEHSVINRTDQLRIVLLVDVLRTHMPWDMRLLTNALVKLANKMVRLRNVL